MRYFLKIFGVIAMIAVIVFGVTACGNINDDDSDSDYGWYGNGSKDSFTIRNFAQLEELARIVKGNTGYDGPEQSDFKGKTVTLTADIDMSGKSWNGIGYSYMPVDPFNGTFDGSNKTISGLNTGNQGFFGLIGEDGIVKDIIFVDLSVNGSDGGGGVARTNRGKIQNVSIINGNVNNMPGGIVYSNSGIVENCNFSGTIAASLGAAGGIANRNYTSGVIRNCYVTGTVTGSSGGGGIVASNGGTIQNCYATCSVNGGTFIGHDTGGIAGSNSGTVKNCYTTGNIAGTIWLRHLGRVAGSGSLSSNYGLNGMILHNSVTVTSDANGIHGADVEASECISQTWWATTVNWDFTTVWEWDSARNLPKLRM